MELQGCQNIRDPNRLGGFLVCEAGRVEAENIARKKLIASRFINEDDGTVGVVLLPKDDQAGQDGEKTGRNG